MAPINNYMEWHQLTVVPEKNAGANGGKSANNVWGIFDISRSEDAENAVPVSVPLLI